MKTYSLIHTPHWKIFQSACLIALALCLLVACREGEKPTKKAANSPTPAPTATPVPLVLEAAVPFSALFSSLSSCAPRLLSAM
jgi:hypothetical protein